MFDVENWEEEWSTPPPEQSKGVHHDPWLMPAQGSDLEATAMYLFGELEAADLKPRTRAPRSDALARRRDMVANLVANLALLKAFHPQGSRLIVSARRERRPRYDRSPFPAKAFTEIITTLEALGFLERVKGGFRGGLRTTIGATAALDWMLPAYGSSLPLVRLAGAETVVLKVRTADGRRSLAGYDDTGETRAFRHEVETINRALGEADIRVDDQRQPPPHLRRLFQIEEGQDASFNKHGRLYGGFWEHWPRAERHRIRIDGQQVAELDFSAMFVQLAYAHAGLPSPKDDPYTLDGMSREAGKLAMATLLSRRSGRMTRLPSDLRSQLGRVWTAAKVQSAMETKHPDIAHLFGTNLAMDLMFTESEILVRTLLRLCERGVTALPIHDAVLVGTGHEAACITAMEQACFQVVGRSLPISVKR